MLTGIWLPIFLAVLATIALLLAQRGIRRGGARYYTLERDAILRRAGFTLIGALVLYVASIALLVYGRQIAGPPTEAEPSAAEVSAGTPTPDATATEVALESQPPTPDLATLLAVAEEAATPTAPVTLRRGEVTGTAGSGVYLREGPSLVSETIETLDDGTLLTFIESEGPIEADGYTWVKVRTLIGLEGWLVDIYIEEIRR